jgi:hypothetical protein
VPMATDTIPVVMDGVREHGEGFPVELDDGGAEEEPRPIIRAFNEGGHNSTEIDLLDLLTWLHRHDGDYGGFLVVKRSSSAAA